MDYSPMALEVWRRETGQDAPAGQGDESWQDFKDFQRRNVEEHIKRWITGVKA